MEKRIEKDGAFEADRPSEMKINNEGEVVEYKENLDTGYTKILVSYIFDNVRMVIIFLFIEANESVPFMFFVES